MPLVCFLSVPCSHTHAHTHIYSVWFWLLPNLIAFHGENWVFNWIIESVYVMQSYRKNPFASIYSQCTDTHTRVIHGIYAHIVSYAHIKQFPVRCSSGARHQSDGISSKLYWQCAGMGYHIAKIHFVQRLFNHNPPSFLRWWPNNNNAP